MFDMQMYPIEKTRFVTSSGGEITWRYITLLYDQTSQMLILQVSQLKQTYSYSANVIS